MFVAFACLGIESLLIIDFCFIFKQIENQIRSYANENSVELISKFADLAESIESSNDAKSID